MMNTNFDDETHSIFLLKAGDRSGFESLYRFYHRVLYSKILSMTKIPAIAEELLQDVFLKVWEKRATIDETRSFRGLLYKITERIVYDHYRKMARDVKMQAHLLEFMAEQYVPADDYILSKERTKLLETALSKLPNQRRMIFTLCKLEDKSYAEAAEILKISTSTVSNQLVKATKYIKHFFFFHSSEFLFALILLNLATNKLM